MRINWNAVIQGITTGTVGAIVFWSFGLVRDMVRNMWLRRMIRQQLRFTSCGSGLGGVTTSVQNQTQRAFRVRDVYLATSKGFYAFNATGEVSSVGADNEAKMTRDIKRRLKRGEAVQISTQIAHRNWQVKLDHTGIVEVRPFTSQGFVLPFELLSGLDGELKHLQISVEYETWTKRTRILTQCTEGWPVENMKKVISQAKTSIADGSINVARQLFKMPPV
jgi:hypothetical protein